jgi:prepilin-type N-terminal cleavage/methylation domain-containing protein
MTQQVAKNQKGFTLVEMAIVLVIIGLLLGGVLKGQELIDNSKIKNAMNDLKGVSAAFNGYYDRFRAIPGDDNNSGAAFSTRGGAWATIPAAATGNANGVLTASNPFAGTSDENRFFWSHVRAAGLLSGDAAAAIGIAMLPKNAFGGLTGVTGGTAATTGIYGMPANGKYVCMGNIPGKAARAMDVAMDDGIANTGTMRSDSGAANVAPTAAASATAAYNDDLTYTVCTTM